MIIIIEGPDGSGKSTLAKYLSDKTGYEIIHRSKPENEEEKRQMYNDYLSIINDNKNVIFDRCWYSEMVYGTVMRDESVIGFKDMYELEDYLSDTGAILIYATGEKDSLWNRCQKRGETYITSREDFNAICDAYDKVMNAPHYIPVVKYVYQEM